MFASLKARIAMYLFRRRLLRDKKSVFKNGTLFSRSNIKVGSYCYVGPDAYWNAVGSITLKDGVIIGPRSFMWTENHDYSNLYTIPYGGANIHKPIVIEEGVWIGADVRICAGVTIRQGAVVALGAVVTKDVEPFTLVGGNPARLISRRDNWERAAEMIAERAYYMKKKLEGT
jgi:maltose O-acetyltransferase